MSHHRMVRHRLRERRARARIGMILFALLLTVGACSARRVEASPAPLPHAAAVSTADPAFRSQLAQGLARPFLQPAHTAQAASDASMAPWISVACIAAIVALHRGRRRMSVRRGENAAQRPHSEGVPTSPM